MKFIAQLLLYVATSQAETPLEQYTPSRSDWSTFYNKAVLQNDKNTDHSPDGYHWVDRDEWLPWDGTVYNASEYSKQDLKNLICPGNTVRGMYELFEDDKPFADNVNPTKAEVDNWHATALNHVRAMVGYTEPEYIIRPTKCQHLRALWCHEKKNTRKWDNDKYLERCEFSTNAHCGAGFIPDKEDQQPDLPAGIDQCYAKAGSEGLFSAAKSNIPWSMKWIRPFCGTLGQEGFWGGHTGPWFHRSEFGFHWNDNDVDNFNSNAGLRAKWSGPSGPSKYINPDITSGRFLVLKEGVNPNPRFPGFECENILWNRMGGADNATQCYDKMMEDDGCGKRFMTYNSGGCACYPTDMASCSAKKVSGRLTWDFEPVVSSFEGLLINITTPLNQNKLPYTGRECLDIIWMKKGAGDPSHCLQQIIENIDNEYDVCGRKFLTWNGGCACYAPSVVSCTKDVTLRRSGRQTYEMEVDPSYNPNPPTSPPISSPTSLVTVSPTSSPTSSPNPPTSPPISSPTSLATDSPTGSPTSCSAEAIIKYEKRMRTAQRKFKKKKIQCNKKPPAAKKKCLKNARKKKKKRGATAERKLAQDEQNCN